jgi:hypothetical protein
VPKIKQSDLDLGYVTRFFIQKVNDQASPILEVSRSQYSKVISDPYYRGASLRWRIVGPKEPVYDQNTGRLIDMGVRESNSKSIELASKKIPNLKLHLPDLTKFWKNM